MAEAEIVRLPLPEPEPQTCGTCRYEALTNRAAMLCTFFNEEVVREADGLNCPVWEAV
jgi:hypothetical protein